VDAQLLSQLHPGAVELQPALQQVAPLRIERGHLPGQPAHHGAFGRIVRCDPAGAGGSGRKAAGIGQPLQQGGADLALQSAGEGGIETAGGADRPEAFHLLQLLHATGQPLRQAPVIERALAVPAAFLLQADNLLAKLPEHAWDAHRRLAVAQFVQQGAAQVGHGEAAEAHGSAGIEGLHGPDQPEAGHLHHVVETAVAGRAEPGGDAAGQRQMGRDQGIAALQAAFRRAAALPLGQLAIAGAAARGGIAAGGGAKHGARNGCSKAENQSGRAGSPAGGNATHPLG